MEEDENIKENVELMETICEKLKKHLSPFEFEALKIKTSNEVEKLPSITLGFDELGLYILFRRARIKMIWLKK